MPQSVETDESAKTHNSERIVGKSKTVSAADGHISASFTLGG
jgi:hypothetical protein